MAKPIFRNIGEDESGYAEEDYDGEVYTDEEIDALNEEEEYAQEFFDSFKI